jgi:hypothetical protein
VLAEGALGEEQREAGVQVAGAVRTGRPAERLRVGVSKPPQPGTRA